MKKNFLLGLTLLFLLHANVNRIEAYSIDRNGNSIIEVDLSLGIPLFYHSLSKVFSSNLYPGGIGALKYKYHILSNLAIGFELRYMFNFDINHSFNLLNPDSGIGKTFSTVPITFLTAYVFDIGEIFQIPIFSNIGFSLSSYGDKSDNISNLRTFDAMPVMSIGSGILWNFNYQWALGITTSWWTMFEFGNMAKTGHFLLISLSVIVNINKL
ncbi:BB0027 family outer member beta-barrel protein [Borrelia parkeri]|uniref:Outer membrane protein n=1 Tax=Borrelia parkeri SLO TaxID=1313294 RepID=A0ABM5PL13_BORPR|nr:hypothetical protein [Borrelia parkeri]AHE62375.1 hypothetical protein X966_00135 [Borrelia parkeri HR1]AHH09918.1 Hypothetical protein BPA_0056300 [Borrelia parkeri SLO]UPA10239.1 hypothetical protein bpSLO_000027 [Borrelia parkeri]